MSDGNSPSTTPNIVFIYIDDMGWKDLGVMGSEYYETPNINRLASDSIYLVASSMNRSISSSVLNTLGEMRAVLSP